MTSIFDGMAGVLNGVLGAPVIWTVDGGSPTTIQGAFRQTPVTVVSPDGGDQLVVAVSIAIQKPIADQVEPDDTVAPGNGNTYRVVAGHPSGSPASDSFVLFELELI